ncbi:hypothetical protein [Nonomuraea dietziae]|uniref:hypothetical protein n=1 Tax=Nonomuraea dietziae TaxID=65515 RepID=UPI003CD09645
MTAKLIRELGTSAGVTLPEVRVTDDGSRLPSAYRVEVAAAVSVGAATAAAAAVLGTEAEVSVREALVAFRDERVLSGSMVSRGSCGRSCRATTGPLTDGSGCTATSIITVTRRCGRWGLSMGSDREAVRRGVREPYGAGGTSGG